MGSSAVPKTVWNVGRATLTTVMSRIDMIAARSTTPEILRTAASIFSGYVGVSGVAIQMTPWCSSLSAADRTVASRLAPQVLLVPHRSRRQQRPILLLVSGAVY